MRSRFNRCLGRGRGRCRLQPCVLLAVGLLLGSAGTVRRVHASAQDIYGYGTRGPSMAGATVALARGYESVYYNPAGLTSSRLISLGVGYQLTDFGLSLRGPALAALAAEDRAVVQGATQLESVGGLTIGASLFLPLHGPLAQRIALGFGFYIPSDVVIRARVPRPYVPRFTVLDRANVVAIQVAGAVRITDWLSIGGGVKALATLIGDIAVHPNELGTLGSTVEDQLIVEYSEILGLLLRPARWLRVGVTYRGEFAGRFSLPIHANLGAQFSSFIGVPTLNIEGLAQYDPRQVLAGVGISPRRGVWLEWAAAWQQWSAYEQPLKSAVDCVPCDPNDPQQPWCNAVDPRAHCLPALGEPRFRDTVSLRIGGEWTRRVRPTLPLWTVVRAGYRYEPSPVPNQSGLNNFLDSDRHVFAAGFAVRWLLQPAVRLVAGLHLQYHLISERTHHKSARWPPAGTSAADYDKIELIAGDLDFRPSLTTSGHILSGGGALGLEF